MGKTYAVAGIQGNFKIWNSIRKFLEEDDCLYVVGGWIGGGNGNIFLTFDLLRDPRVRLIANYDELLMYLNCGQWSFRYDSNGSVENVLEVSPSLLGVGTEPFRELVIAGVDVAEALFDAMKPKIVLHDYIYNKKGQRIILNPTGEPVIESYKPGMGEDIHLALPILEEASPYHISKKSILIDECTAKEVVVFAEGCAAKIKYDITGQVDEKCLFLRYRNGERDYIAIDSGVESTYAVVLIDLDTLEPVKTFVGSRWISSSNMRGWNQ